MCGCWSCSRSGTRSTWSACTTRWRSAGKPPWARLPADEVRNSEHVTTPRISVVVAFFNNEDDLGDCLDSIAAQTHPDLEGIMVDGGSGHHSPEIARARAGPGPRFTCLEPGPGGPGGARNRGVERARGEYLAFV